MQGYQERHSYNHDNDNEDVEHIKYDSDLKRLEWHARDAYQGLRWSWRGGMQAILANLPLFGVFI